MTPSSVRPVVTFDSRATFREVQKLLGPEYILHYLGESQYLLERRSPSPTQYAVRPMGIDDVPDAVRAGGAA